MTRPLYNKNGALPLGTKLLFGVGTIAYGIKENGFSALLLLYYNQVVGLPAAQVGLAIMCALIVDAILDPIVGYTSDNFRSRLGRRHPFMYAAALPAGLLYMLLWTPPEALGTSGTLIYLIMVSVAIRAIISCYEIPSAALVPELSRNYHERTSILGFRTIFGWLGGTLMLLVTFGVLLRPTELYPVGQLNPEGYRHYGMIASILIIVAILTSTLGTHRYIPLLRKPDARTEKGEPIWASLKVALSNKAFLILLGAGACMYTVQGLNFALSTYFNTYLWEFSARTIALYTAIIILGAFVAFTLARTISARIGKKQAARIAILLSTSFSVTPLLLRYGGLFPGNDSPALLPLVMGFTLATVSFGVCATLLVASMMSDVVEYEQERSGKRTEGTFFAGNFFIQKCVTGIGLFLSGAILAIAAFPDEAVPGEVSFDVLGTMILVFSGINVTFGLLAAFVVGHFPISQTDHEERLVRLSASAE